MIDFLNNINPLFLDFILVLLFSFSLGVERRKQYALKKVSQTFGTDRTFTFIGLLGFLLLIVDTEAKMPYFIGFGALTLFLCVYYAMKTYREGSYGITSILLALITYGFPLLVFTTTLWMSLLFFVVVLTLTGVKKSLREMSRKIDDDEFATLAKFIVIAGIILPILPHENISDKFIPVSPYKIWLAVVVVSGISYISYLLRKYVFPKAGLLLTGVLGGMYSSMASTVILARKSKVDDTKPKAYAGAIIIATAMMYIRILILMMIFSPKIVSIALPYFVALFLISLAVGIFLYRSQRVAEVQDAADFFEDDNPLEFKVALVFATLYVLFTIITHLVITHFGESGLSALSVLVGVTDITPFLLNLFQGQYSVAAIIIVIATLQATASNNVLKMIYAQVLSGKSTGKYVLRGFITIILANLVAVGILYLIK